VRNQWRLWRAGLAQMTPVGESEKPVEVVEGWARPDDARRRHYFVDGESLCGKWRLPNWQSTYYALCSDYSGGNCAICVRKLEERRCGK